MQKYSVQGMSCAACQARVEKAVSKVPGVTECSVSLLTNSMGVEGQVDPEKIIKAVEKAGYSASIAGGLNKSKENSAGMAKSDPLENKESGVLARRLVSSLIFLLVLMYFSMGHMMWNWPLPAWFDGNHVAMGLVQMILAAIVMIINKKFFVNGFKSLFHLSPNMDTLVALGSGISFVYSTVVLFEMTGAVVEDDSQLVMHCMDNLYFEGAAMIVTLITIGKLLESISKGKTTNALKSLMKLAPDTATVIRDGKECIVPVAEVEIGSVFLVKPGENIPVDGEIIEGQTAINESSITGESIPVDKVAGDSVVAGTTNTNGFIKCRAVRVGEDTTIAKIIQMVSDAAATKAPIARIADKVSGVFVPAVMSISLITIIIWLICGADFSFALSRGIAVLVVSCPCALGLATPVAIMVGNGVGARKGILFKTSASLENAGKTGIVVLDKTGTITKGEPGVVDVQCNDEDPDHLLQVALDLEKRSEHPLAKAIVEYTENKGMTAENVEQFEAVGGKGVVAKAEKNVEVSFFGGNLSFIKEKCAGLFENGSCSQLEESVKKISEKGETPLVFAEKNGNNEKLLGIISVADMIKPEAADAVEQLKNLGLNVVMLTGDNEITARAIAEKAGVDQVIAGVLPQGKAEAINKLKQGGKVCMVGDGVNDAVALTSADIGFAIGAGADVAIDAADVVLVKSRLDDVCRAIKLSRRTLVNIKENLFWAFIYNIVLIPIAAGAYYHLLGLEMNPMLGAAAMSLSSFCVVSNALRLNLVNLDRKVKSKRRNSKKLVKSSKMEENMEKIIKVDGMMCEHCEARVKEALEKIKGVESAAPDHTTGEVKLVLTKEIKDKDFEKVITKAGYTFVK